MQPGMPNLQQIVLQAQQMQAEMQRAQASLTETEVTGSAGGGVVTVTLTASGELRGVRIDPAVVDPSDVETLEDLVVAAFHDARRVAERTVNDTMGAVAGGLAGSLDLSALGFPGLGGGIPGLGQTVDADLDDDDLDNDDLDDTDLDADEDFADDDLSDDDQNAAAGGGRAATDDAPGRATQEGTDRSGPTG